MYSREKSQLWRTAFMFAAILALCPVGLTAAKDFHAAPDGQPSGDGSEAAPWDLATALAATTLVGAGDTLWLHEGVYRGGFECRLSGKPEAPVTVRQARGEHATIDCRPADDRGNGMFIVAGDHAVFWGFEVTCSDPKRVTDIGGSWPADIRRGEMFCRASHVKFINLVVHDTAGGFGFWSEGEGGEIYGSLIYHNGWQGPDRGHGHAIYAQNRVGSKRLADNILFRQFGAGIHCYGSDKAFVQGFEIEGNIGFQNGSLAKPKEHTPAIFVGGGTCIERVTVADNYTYDAGLRCGYPWGSLNRDVVVRDNYVVGGLFVRDFKQVAATGNTVIAPSGLVAVESSAALDTSSFAWDKNHYYRTGDLWSAFEVAQGEKRKGYEFTQWREATGFDATSTFEGKPSGVRVFVRPNRYEPGRAHVVVYNWDRADTVEIDVGGVLNKGDRYRLVSAQDFFGEALLKGTYERGPLRLGMQKRKVVLPIGMPNFEPPPTEPEFGAYVILLDIER